MAFRTGIIQVLFDHVDCPLTIEEIANLSGKDDRFVRELINGLICADILLTNDKTETLKVFVDEERTSALRSTGLYCQEIPLLNSCAMNNIEQSFQSGKGLDYSTYPSFSSFMDDLSQQKHKDVLISTFLPSVANGKLVQDLERGIQVADFGCGHGLVSVLMAEKYPNSHFYGFDILEDAILAAKERAARRNISNCSFEVLDLSNNDSVLHYHEKFDYVTAFDSIHDQTEPVIALESAFKLLKPSKESIFSLIDIKAHSNVMDTKTIHLLHSCIQFRLCIACQLGKEKTVKEKLWG